MHNAETTRKTATINSCPTLMSKTIMERSVVTGTADEMTRSRVMLLLCFMMKDIARPFNACKRKKEAVTSWVVEISTITLYSLVEPTSY